MSEMDKSVAFIEASAQRGEVKEFLDKLDPEYASGLIRLLHAQFKLLLINDGEDKKLAITLLSLAGVALTRIANKSAEEVIKDLTYLEDKVFETGEALKASGIDMEALGAEVRAKRGELDDTGAGHTLH